MSFNNICTVVTKMPGFLPFTPLGSCYNLIKGAQEAEKSKD